MGVRDQYHEKLFLLARQLARIAEELLIDSDQVFAPRSSQEIDQASASVAAALESSAFSFADDANPIDGANADSANKNDNRKARMVRPPLPDPRLVRRIIRHRQIRARIFGDGLFADPAWDMLLDLTAARVEHKRVSVTSLCIASGVPPTTALRWIGQLTDEGMVVRVEDETDRRRAFIALSDRGADRMAQFFDELGQEAVWHS